MVTNLISSYESMCALYKRINKNKGSMRLHFAVAWSMNKCFGIDRPTFIFFVSDLLFFELPQTSFHIFACSVYGKLNYLVLSCIANSLSVCYLVIIIYALYRRAMSHHNKQNVTFKNHMCNQNPLSHHMFFNLALLHQSSSHQRDSLVLQLLANRPEFIVKLKYEILMMCSHEKKILFLYCWSRTWFLKAIYTRLRFFLTIVILVFGIDYWKHEP